MKPLAHNILPGRIVGLVRGSHTTQVKIELAPQLVVVSTLANAEMGELELKVGDRVSAVVNSSDVRI